MHEVESSAFVNAVEQAVAQFSQDIDYVQFMTLIITTLAPLGVSLCRLTLRVLQLE
jgi:hypothetical protein